MTQFLLKDIIKSDIGEISIIDVGAMLEGTPRYDLLMRNYKTHVTGFEPNKEQYKKLCDLKQSSAHYLPYFLADTGESTFYIACYPVILLVTLVVHRFMSLTCHGIYPFAWTILCKTHF